jgi:hypothetical protein
MSRVGPLDLLGGWREESDALATRFAAARPFPHLVLDGFLRDEACRALLEAFPSWERGNSLDENGRPGGKSVVEALRTLGPPFAALDALAAHPDFLALLGRLTGIAGLIYDPAYVGGGTHENRSGQQLDFHVDFNRHPHGWHRRLNLLLYLNPRWEENWGGVLELRRVPEEPGERVAPCFNRAVVFATSERSWHGFDRLDPPEGITRRSIAFYFYTREPPPGGSRSTVYVDPLLPADATLEELRRLAQRRREHLDRLLARDRQMLDTLLLLAEQTFAVAPTAPPQAERAAPLSLMDELIGALYRREPRLRETLERALTWPRVRARAPVRVIGQEGLWHDGWAGAHLAITLHTDEPVAGLRIRGVIPEAIGRQPLTLRSAAGGAERSFPPGRFAWDVALDLPDGTHLIEIEAGATFSPRLGGSSDDARPLAWLIEDLGPKGAP